MNLPFIDLKAQYAHLKDDLDRRIQTVLDHGGFIMGPEVKELEQELARFCGCAHAICVASGTDALLAALMAEDIGPGDSVFLPSFTFSATAEVVLLLGARPVFVDVDERTFNIDPADLEEKIASVRAGDGKPRTVIPVDLFGQPADYDAVNALAEREGLLVLADAAQSFGATFKGQRTGTLARVTATSFFPAKPLGCYGDGGAVFTDDDDLADILRSIRLHGKGVDKYEIVRVGLNSRLDTLQAAVLLVKLAAFEDELAARNRIADEYSQRLSDHASVPVVDDRMSSAWAQFCIFLDEGQRDAVADALKTDGIPSAIYYPVPMHLQPAYSNFGDGPGSLPVSESLSRRILALPMHPYMTDDAIALVCDAVERATRNTAAMARNEA